MANVSVSIDRSNYRMNVRSGRHSWIADEPASSGGTDEGPSPDELLASALGACTCATLRMYADRKGWPLEGAEADVAFHRDREKNESHFTRNIRLRGNLSEEQRDRLLAIANQCFVHRVLTNPIHINTVLSQEV
jgi:putative redox protein